VWGPNSEWAGDRYEGGFVDGDFHGSGFLVYANGDRYEGEHRYGKQHGRGNLVFAGGNKYQGEFWVGSFNGRGVFTFANGNECEGDWRDDRLVGMGKGRENGLIKKCYEEEGTITFRD
jgi:hypothetical protein